MSDHNLRMLDDALGRAADRLQNHSLQPLFRRLALALRRSQQQRMGQQVGPDGQSWAPRKNSRRRREKMMRRLRSDAFLRYQTDSTGLRLYFTAATIAARHHCGGVERLQFGLASFPARPLLGLNPADEFRLLMAIQRHLEEAL